MDMSKTFIIRSFEITRYEAKRRLDKLIKASRIGAQHPVLCFQCVR